MWNNDRHSVIMIWITQFNNLDFICWLYYFVSLKDWCVSDEAYSTYACFHLGLRILSLQSPVRGLFESHCQCLFCLEWHFFLHRQEAAPKLSWPCMTILAFPSKLILWNFKWAPLCLLRFMLILGKKKSFFFSSLIVFMLVYEDIFHLQQLCCFLEHWFYGMNKARGLSNR